MAGLANRMSTKLPNWTKWSAEKWAFSNEICIDSWQYMLIPCFRLASFLANDLELDPPTAVLLPLRFDLRRGRNRWEKKIDVLPLEKGVWVFDGSITYDLHFFLQRE